MRDPDEIFEPIGAEIDPDGIVEDIDVNEIEEQAKNVSFAMCKNLREIYFDEEFMQRNPRFKERLDVELESLRVLIKMRKSDERAHDLCLRSIGMNTNNASLYAALARIQTSMLNIQKQMDETVRNINALLKNVQLELNFDNQQQTQPQTDSVQNTTATRGSKDFIDMMNDELKKEANKTVDEIDPTSLFDDSITEPTNDEQ